MAEKFASAGMALTLAKAVGTWQIFLSGWTQS